MIRGVGSLRASKLVMSRTATPILRRRRSLWGAVHRKHSSLDRAILETVTDHALTTSGVLQCLDGYMNIAMEQTEEHVNGVVTNRYGDAFIRGNNGMSSISISRAPIFTPFTVSTVYFCCRSFVNYHLDPLILRPRSLSRARTATPGGRVDASAYSRLDFSEGA